MGKVRKGLDGVNICGRSCTRVERWWLSGKGRTRRLRWAVTWASRQYWDS